MNQALIYSDLSDYSVHDEIVDFDMLDFWENVLWQQRH